MGTPRRALSSALPGVPATPRTHSLRAPLQASQVLGTLLLAGSAGGDGDGTVVSVWQLLPLLDARQLSALSACPAFFDLPHSEAPHQALGLPAVDAMLEVTRLKRLPAGVRLLRPCCARPPPAHPGLLGCCQQHGLALLSTSA